MKQFAASLCLLITFILGRSPSIENLTQVAFSQEVPEMLIEPSSRTETGQAVIRTPEDMEQAEAERDPIPEFVVPFMPTMDPEEYEAEKNEANSEAARGAVPEGVEMKSHTPVPRAPVPNAPPTLRAINFNGVNQNVAGGAPPDTHGAVGPSHFVEVVNNAVVVYDKTGTQLSNRPLQAFFGALEGVFDPRVVFDRLYNRWVIVATRVSTAATDPNQRYFLAVSTTADPAGSYFIYVIGFRVPGIDNGDWWDFPQLGLEQDAVIVTGNVFDTPAGGFKFAAMMSFPKSQIYNGLAYVSPVFTGLRGTLAPPIVRDNNKDTYLVAASNGTGLHLYRGEDLSNGAEASLRLQVVIDVPDYRLPPDAPQCGTTELLDTVDFRFVNASTQVGDSLWNVHTRSIASADFPGTFAVLTFYEIDTEGSGANTLKQRGLIFASGSSHDFNGSIAVNDFGDAFVTYSSTDPRATPCLNAQVRFSGRQSTDPRGVIPAGVALFTSPTALTGGSCTPPCAENFQRWGDYSAVTVDPEPTTNCPGGRAWIVNETIVNANTWGSRIARIGFCD